MALTVSRNIVFVLGFWASRTVSHPDGLLDVEHRRGVGPSVFVVLKWFIRLNAAVPCRSRRNGDGRVFKEEPGAEAAASRPTIQLYRR